MPSLQGGAAAKTRSWSMTVAGSATSAPIRCPESAGYTLTPQRIHLPARRFQRCSP